MTEKKYQLEKLTEDEVKEILSVPNVGLNSDPSDDPKPFDIFQRAKALIEEIFDFKNLVLECSYDKDGKLSAFELTNGEVQENGIVYVEEHGLYKPTNVEVSLLRFRAGFWDGCGEFNTLFQPLHVNMNDVNEFRFISRNNYNGDFGITINSHGDCEWLGLRGKFTHRFFILDYLERVRFFYTEFEPVQKIMQSRKLPFLEYIFSEDGEDTIGEKYDGVVTMY